MISSSFQVDLQLYQIKHGEGKTAHLVSSLMTTNQSNNVVPRNSHTDIHNLHTQPTTQLQVATCKVATPVDYEACCANVSHYCCWFGPEPQ